VILPLEVCPPASKPEPADHPDDRVASHARFRFILCTIARKASGSKVAMDLLKASHGPRTNPAARAERMMSMSSDGFRFRAPRWRAGFSACSYQATL
jgi:hypothetical protein